MSQTPDIDLWRPAPSDPRRSTPRRSTSRTPAPSSLGLDILQAAAYLGVTERFMRRVVYERRIPFHKVGSLLRFRVADLDAFFEAGRVETS